MSDKPTKPSAEKRVTRFAFLIGVAALGYCIRIWTAPAPSNDLVDATVLRQSVPIALDMTFTIEETVGFDSGESSLKIGTMEYRFTNITPKPVKFAFPPKSVNRFSPAWMNASDATPPFAKQRQTFDFSLVRASCSITRLR